MKLAHFACAIGRHRVDADGVKKVFGMNVGRCAHCATPLEEDYLHHWVPLSIRDAELERRWR